MMSDSIVKTGSLDEWLSHEGFNFWGLTEANVFPEDTERYRLWLAHQQHGAMDFLERHLPFKYNPDLLLKGCKSLIMVGLNYFQPFSEVVLQEQGRVALYAWGRDYHKILLRKLKQLIVKLQALYPDRSFLAGVDATPLSEGKYAEQAGLGWRGKNTLIINADFGSWFVIGEILSNVPLSELQEQLSRDSLYPVKKIASTQPPVQRVGNCPTGCKLCQKACPTNALYAPYRLDASRCISYLTIEYKKEIHPEAWPGLQDWLFGCDICQRACPFNRQASQTNEPDFLKDTNGGLLSLAGLLKIKNTEEYKQLFAGSPLMRTGRSRLLRNAIIVATNTKAQELRPLIKQLRKDEDPLIAWHAQRAENCF